MKKMLEVAERSGKERIQTEVIKQLLIASNNQIADKIIARIPKDQGGGTSSDGGGHAPSKFITSFLLKDVLKIFFYLERSTKCRNLTWNIILMFFIPNLYRKLSYPSFLFFSSICYIFLDAIFSFCLSVPFRFCLAPTICLFILSPLCLFPPSPFPISLSLSLSLSLSVPPCLSCAIFSLPPPPHFHVLSILFPFNVFVPSSTS